MPQRSDRHEHAKGRQALFPCAALPHDLVPGFIQRIGVQIAHDAATRLPESRHLHQGRAPHIPLIVPMADLIGDDAITGLARFPARATRRQPDALACRKHGQ